MSRMPCGNCDVGTYAVQAALNAIELYRGCETLKDGLRRTPSCACEPGKICAGGVDFLRAADFPLNDERCDEITRQVMS